MLVPAHLSRWSPLPDFTGSLWQRVLHQSVHLGILNMSGDIVLGQMGLAVRVYFWVRQLSEL